jgi:hypothetical protein
MQKAYLNLSSTIQYYLCCPEFSTQRLDNALVTDLRNAKASAYWEGQISVAIQDVSLCFLFENKGSMYDGKGFKMLAALNQHCRPDSVANAFTTLMSLFNDSMGKLEEIMALRSRFDGMVNNMSRCKIILPPVLMVMFFLCSLHSCYINLLEQFCSCYKSFEGTPLDSIVADVRYHNEFKLVGSDKKVSARKGAKAVAATASYAVDKQGKEWRNPYEWLASFDIKGIKKRWTHLLAGNGFGPICHYDKDKHAPITYLLLAELNLKLIGVSPPAGPPATAPAPAASPSPGGISAMAESIAFYYPSCKQAVVKSLPPPLAPPPLLVVPTGQSISWRLLPPNPLSYLNILCQLLHICQLHQSFLHWAVILLWPILVLLTTCSLTSLPLSPTGL